jgi:hypothetical protein
MIGYGQTRSGTGLSSRFEHEIVPFRSCQICICLAHFEVARRVGVHHLARYPGQTAGVDEAGRLVELEMIVARLRAGMTRLQAEMALKNEEKPLLDFDKPFGE